MMCAIMRGVCVLAKGMPLGVIVFIAAQLFGAQNRDIAEDRLTRITISAGSGEQIAERKDQDHGEFNLVGRDSRQQLVVTGIYESGDVQDLTHKANYRVHPETVARVSNSGVVSSVSEGEGTVTASFDGYEATINFVVSRIVDDVPVSFSNQITPMLTKLGCNSGGCHGKSGGQNGFRLSLLGFDPAEDYEHIVHEGRGRRVFPAAPEQSLLLLKATGEVPHGGGERIAKDSAEYRALRRWIAQGMPRGESISRVVTQIEFYPKERTLAPRSEQQLTCIAHYNDGSSEDVTSLARFACNEPEMAEIDSSGLVRVSDRVGVAAIMAQYQGHVAVFRATIPLGKPVDNLPPAKNYIDELVYKQWKKLGLPPSQLCDDSTFLRRVSLHIAGRLPTSDEVTQFLDDSDSEKRSKWVNRLLASSDYADYFANKWSAILRNKRRTDADARGTFLFHSWIRESLLENKPYDQFVREIVTASGEIGENPPVVWYREVKDAAQQIEDLGQVFLGTRIQCAHCHHHPLEKWSQEDYFGLSAFFSQVGRKRGDQPNEERIFHRRGQAVAKHPKTKASLPPKPLDGETIDVAADNDPRHALVDWMVEPSNRFFAPALTNRYWKHFFGRGIVEAEDDMRETNPASNPELLEAMSRHFVESGYDLKQLIRTICASNVYQLESEPNPSGQSDTQNFSRFYPRRLSAEVLLDAVDQVCGSKTQFSPLPSGTRAVALPDAGFRSHFLTVFGRPEGNSACECERTDDSNLAQSLHMLNSPEMQAKLSIATGRAAQWATDTKRSHAEKVHELYLIAFARPPRPKESAAALEHIANSETPKKAYEDLIWTLLNTKEFLFNH